MPMINILLAKIYLQDIFPNVEPAIFVVGLVILMTAANLRGINVIANLSTVDCDYPNWGNGGLYGLSDSRRFKW